MASAAMATSQAKRCSGDLTVLRKSNTSRRLQPQRSKLEKIRGNAEDPACPPDLVGFGAVPFETEPHRVTEYAKLPAHTVFPVGQIFSFASRKFQYLHRSTSYPAQNTTCKSMAALVLQGN